MLPIHELRAAAGNWWSTSYFSQTLSARVYPQSKAVVQYDLLEVQNPSHR